MKKLLLSILLLASPCFAGVTCFQIDYVSDVHYVISAWGPLPDGAPKFIEVTSPSDIQKITKFYSQLQQDVVFGRSIFFLNDNGTFNRGDVQLLKPFKPDAVLDLKAAANTDFLIITSMIEGK